MKKTLCLMLVVVLLAACLSGCAADKSALVPNEGTSYFIYLGLADATTGKQELAMDEALALVRQSLTEKKQGATVLPTWGTYLDETGAVCENETILVILSADEATASAMATDWQAALHSACVYIERYDIQYGIIGGQI